MLQKQSQDKVLLSELAGVAESLDGCVMLNLWDVEEVVDVIYKAMYTSKEMRLVNSRSCTDTSRSLPAGSGVVPLSARYHALRNRLRLDFWGDDGLGFAGKAEKKSNG